MLRPSLIYEHPLQPPGPSTAPPGQRDRTPDTGCPPHICPCFHGCWGLLRAPSPLPRPTPPSNSPTGLSQHGRCHPSMPASSSPPSRCLITAPLSVLLLSDTPAMPRPRRVLAARHIPGRPSPSCRGIWYQPPARVSSLGSRPEPHRFLTCFIALLCKTTLWLVTFFLIPVSRPRTCQLWSFPLVFFHHFTALSTLSFLPDPFTLLFSFVICCFL